MITRRSVLTWILDEIIISHPRVVILSVLAVVTFLGFHARNFQLDASAETLLLENDKDLKYSRLINSRYGQQDFLILACRPNGDLLSADVRNTLERLRDDLEKLERVSSVVTILDVPLLESPKVPIKELSGNIRTLESPTIDIQLVRKEFTASSLYQNLLVSPDLRTTALLINLSRDETYQRLLERRDQLREKERAGPHSSQEKLELQRATADFDIHREKMRDRRHADIVSIRQIMDNYRGDADLFLGGVGMIADDMISFIKDDLRIFSIGVLLFLIITLGIIFRTVRWVFVPLLCCTLSAVSMIGLLGLFGWEVTVVSSNFISLQLILTLAISIHLVVRYRELQRKDPDRECRDLVRDTISSMARPCLYAGLTTIAGFGSLLLCDILPIITFGWMMVAGVVVSLTITFVIFPAMIVLFGKSAPVPQRDDSPFSITGYLARLTETRGTIILLVSIIVTILSGIGISRLVVENRFIDYFKKTTEIHRGMEVIDQTLGGTTPLDVVIDFEKPVAAGEDIAKKPAEASEYDEFDEFEEFEESENEEKYWLTSDKVDRIMAVHDYLDALPETGKILSLGTLMKTMERLNDNTPLDNFTLAILYNAIPDNYKSLLITPYVSTEHNQARFFVRVRDSEKSLQRDKLLKQIRNELTAKLGIKKENVHLSGMLVLYNNMLQSLFSSQIKTLGAVLLALMCMFLVLFRSLKIAVIAILPNILSVAVVLGVMGWLKIPLDMMTITIAAISVGIAVDDTIHYIHRFIREFDVDRNYVQTVYRCHRSIGYAMYYTSLTIIAGFSILSFSNFIPTIYFGLLTGLAMAIALLSALTLLPQLLVVVKPLGPES